MKRSDALAILGLNGRESVDVLKSAYRKRAFETHPDRGGSVAEFLKVQAAYEVLLSDVRGGYTEGLDDVLAERLNDVHNAFALLDDEAGQYCQRVFEGFHKALFEVIDAYESYSQLKQDAERDITFLWSRAAGRISDFPEAKSD
jgi:DnaJ-class molecular chaperone